MPAIPAIGALLSTAGGASLAAAGVTAVGSMYAANQANRGVQQGIAAQDRATAEAMALQNRAMDIQQQQFNTTRQDQLPYTQAGYSALDQLLAQYIPNYRPQSLPTSYAPQQQQYAPQGQPQTYKSGLVNEGPQQFVGSQAQGGTLGANGLPIDRISLQPSLTANGNAAPEYQLPSWASDSGNDPTGMASKATFFNVPEQMSPFLKLNEFGVLPGTNLTAADYRAISAGETIPAQIQSRLQIERMMAGGPIAGTAPLDGEWAARAANGGAPSQGQGGGQQGGGQFQSVPDWSGYLSTNPDIAAVAQRGVQTGEIGPNGQWKTPEEWAQWHYESGGGRQDNRNLPMAQIPMQGQQQQYAPQQQYSQAPAWGYEPTAAQFGVAGGPPSLGGYLGGYETSAAYKVKEKRLNDNVNSGYAAKRMLRSGSAINAIQQGTKNLLTEDEQAYNQLGVLKYQGDIARYDAQQRSFQNALGQYNTNRNFTQGNIDTGTNNLFKIAGMGQSAASATSAAGQNYANSAGNILSNQGNLLANQGQYTAAGYDERAANNIFAANGLGDAFNNVLTNWRPQTAPITPISPYGTGMSLQPKPSYVPNLTPTPNFNSLRF